MTAKLEMCDESWSCLMEDVIGVRNLAHQVRGLVPNHLWSRLDYLADDMERVLNDGVEVVQYDEEPRSHINLEEGEI